MPESGLQAAERPISERLATESQILGETGDLSEYRSKWTAGGELPDGYAKLALFTQPAPNGLEVAVVESTKAPRKSELEEIWRKRKGGRASPVLVVAVPAGAVAMPPADAVPPADTYTSQQPLPLFALTRCHLQTPPLSQQLPPTQPPAQSPPANSPSAVQKSKLPPSSKLFRPNKSKSC